MGIFFTFFKIQEQKLPLFIGLSLASGPLSPDIGSESSRNKSDLLQNLVLSPALRTQRADLHPVATLGISLPLWAARGN